MRSFVVLAFALPIFGCSSSESEFDPAADPKSPLAKLDYDGSPAAVDRTVEAAMLAFKAKQFAEVKAITDDLLIAAPHHPKADVVLFLAAEARVELGELDAAAQMYQRLASTYPSSRPAAIVPQRLYDIASARLEEVPTTWLEALGEDDQHALDALGRVAIDYPNSAPADDAWMTLAAAHLADGEAELAARAYVRLIEAHPNSEHVEEASFRLVEALADKSRGKGYDTEPLLEARDAAVAYLKRFGTEGRHSVAAARAIEQFTKELVANEHRIADFYEARGNAVGAEMHRNNARRLSGEATVGADSTDLLKSRTSRSKFADLESRRGFLFGWPSSSPRPKE